MALVLKVPTTIICGKGSFDVVNGRRRCYKVVHRKRVSTSMVVRMLSTPMQYLDKPSELRQNTIMVNGCTGKMGKAVVEAAVSAGLHVVPVSFSSSEVSGKIVQVGGKEIQVYGPSDRESILASTVDEYPNLVVVDYTVPATVNAAMEIMAEQFPGAFSGYSLLVMESHQASKVDTSGTAKAVISCFQKLDTHDPGSKATT